MVGADLLARHPALVVLNVSGYGMDSAQVDDVWTETLAWARLGFFYRQPGYREGPKMPTFPAGSYASVFNGTTAALAAIHVRNETGRGQVVDTSIADGLAAPQAMLWFWSEKDKPSNKPLEIRGGGMGRRNGDGRSEKRGESEGSNGSLERLGEHCLVTPVRRTNEVGRCIDHARSMLPNA